MGRVVALGIIFANLHVPQGLAMVPCALGGGPALRGLMLWRGSLVLVAVLHPLFNMAPGISGR